MELKIDLASFRTWLEANKDVEVGLQNNSKRCAFARYLMAQGVPYAKVNHARVDTSELQMRTPRWLEKFIENFDVASGTGATPQERDGKFALECLFRAEQALENEVYTPTELFFKAQQKLSMLDYCYGAFITI